MNTAFYPVVQQLERVLEFGTDDTVERFSTLPVSRVICNTPTLFGGMGYSSAVDPSFVLGTGTWSGSICSDNVTPLHLVNIKRIAHEARPWRQIAEDTRTAP